MSVDLDMLVRTGDEPRCAMRHASWWQGGLPWKAACRSYFPSMRNPGCCYVLTYEPGAVVVGRPQRKAAFVSDRRQEVSRVARACGRGGFGVRIAADYTQERDLSRCSLDPARQGVGEASRIPSDASRVATHRCLLQHADRVPDLRENIVRHWRLLEQSVECRTRQTEEVTDSV